MELRERESVHRSINVDTGQAGSQVMEHNMGSSASLLHSFNKGWLCFRHYFRLWNEDNQGKEDPYFPRSYILVKGEF